MKLNIQTLKNEGTMTFEEKTQVSLQNMHVSTNQRDYEVGVCGQVTRKGELYTVCGFVDITLKLFCDRCMAEVLCPVHAEVFCEFSPSQKYLDEDEDIQPVTKSSIDLSNTILESIAMNLPMKVLCKEDCQGMCKKCGVNLNHEACKCEGFDIDPRLEQLKDIFRVSNGK